MSPFKYVIRKRSNDLWGLATVFWWENSLDRDGPLDDCMFDTFTEAIAWTDRRAF